MSLATAVEVLEDFKLQERASLKSSSKMTEDGVLEGVHLIGLIGKANTVKGSKKPYTYAEGAIKEAVEKKLYDGAPIYLGHPETDDKGNEKPRNPTDRIATVVNSHFKEGVGALSKLQFNTGHPYYEAMQFWIDKDPSAIMMSHVADLKYNAESCQMVKIAKVHSVDIVINGNTTTGMFKEGVLADAISVEDEQRKLQRLLDTAQSMFWRVIYPAYSSDQKKVLTDSEKAVQCATIAKDLVKELNALGSTKKEEAADMELKDLTLEMLKKDRSDLIKSIESAAIEADHAITAKVEEAVKAIPADKRTKLFLKQVREGIVGNHTDDVAELVKERSDLLSVKAPESTATPPVAKVTQTESTNPAADKAAIEASVAKALGIK